MKQTQESNHSWLALVISIGLHTILLTIIGGVVLFPGYISQLNFVGAITAQESDEMVPPPMDEDMPLEPEAGGGGTEGLSQDLKLASDPTEMTDVPLDFNTDVITSTMINPALTIPKGNTGINMLDIYGQGTFGSGGGVGGGQGGGIGRGIGNAKGTLFGFQGEVKNALKGYFYDLKRAKSGKTSDIAGDSGGSHAFNTVLREFVTKQKFDTKKLDLQFWRSPEPLYGTWWITRRIGAKTAPEAFKIEAEAKNWIIVYQGEVSPPETGDYAFFGFADDVMIIGISDKVVLDASWPINDSDNTKDGRVRSGWNKTSGPDLMKEYGIGDDSTTSFAGDWVNMQKGKRYKMSVVVGEQPGGYFRMMLGVMKKGETYEKSDSPLQPRCPVFVLEEGVPVVTGTGAPNFKGQMNFGLGYNLE